MSRLLRALKTVGGWLLALLILFEEWGWAPLSRLMARIGALPLFRQIERWVGGLPPYAALALFIVPTVLLLPVKLLALWLIGIGRAGLGLAVIVLAKLVGTAVMARLFQLTQPALMRLAWFARLYTRWLAWKTALLAQVRASRAWHELKRARRLARRAWLRWRLLFA
ncbi:hypothetical protein [Roseateles toxinivorans]|uniref:Transmembrane protein n=1 Tax=Roseateles toxinivorans TaxID=270368 RepID=A0A4V3CTI2_9BURK|nr:hypothetical protein [Roseateles toxinivorans]TDP72394.1 hypothetical protein DES47_102139 [Roseateles toxinivorans]